MEEYKTDAEIYAVLEREIIDLTLRPGSSLSENPLCARFGAPRSMIRVVLQRLQENGLVKIVPYKGTTVTRLNREIVDELIYERTAVEARVLRDFSPKCTPEQRALIRRRADAYAALARAEEIDYNKLYEADRLLHETWFAAMGKMYLWRTLQNAHADYSRFRMLDTMTSGGLDEVIADHQNIIAAIERCDLAAFEPLVERHLYGGRGGIATGNGKRQRHRFGHRFLTPRVRALNPPNAQPDAEQDDCGGGITAPRTEQRDTLGRMRIRMQLHAALHLRPRRNGQSRLRVVQLAPQCFIQRIPFHLRSPPLLSVF